MSVPINSALKLLCGRWKNERRSFTKKVQNTSQLHIYKITMLKSR